MKTFAFVVIMLVVVLSVTSNGLCEAGERVMSERHKQLMSI